jgi:hypothetical protein
MKFVKGNRVEFITPCIFGYTKKKYGLKRLFGTVTHITKHSHLPMIRVLFDWCTVPQYFHEDHFVLIEQSVKEEQSIMERFSEDEDDSFLTNLDNKYLKITEEAIEKTGKCKIVSIAHDGAGGVLDDCFALHKIASYPEGHSDFWKVWDELKEKQNKKIR